MQQPQANAAQPAAGKPAAPAATAVPAADPKLTHVAATLAHSSPLISCRFDPKGRFVLAGAQDSTVQRWELASGKKLAPLVAHDSWIRAIAFSPDGETTYTGGYDGRLMWWPTAAAGVPAVPAASAPNAAAAPNAAKTSTPTGPATGAKVEPIRKIDAHNGWLRSMSVSPDGKLVATGGNDQLVKVWNAADGKLVHALAGHERHVYSVLFHPGGQFLLSGDLLGQVKQWDAATGKLVRGFDAKELYEPNRGQAAEYGGVRTMAISPDGKHLVCGGLYKGSNPFGAVQDPLVLRFEWESAKKLINHTASGDLKGIIWRLAFLADGTLVGASGGGGGGILLFWKAETASEIFRFALPNTALDMDLAPDGIQLATAHHDRNLRICRMAAKKA